MTRHEDWFARLQAVLPAYEGKRFRYGRFDCALFAADMIEVMTGEDPAVDWRARYGNKREAMNALRKAGGLDQAVTQAMGEPISPAFAQRGDLVMLEEDGGSLGINLGNVAVMPARPQGLYYAPLSSVIAAWRV